MIQLNVVTKNDVIVRMRLLVLFAIVGPRNEGKTNVLVQELMNRHCEKERLTILCRITLQNAP